VKMFNLKRMLGLLAVGGAVYYARSRKIDVLGKLGLRRGASPDNDRDTSTQAGFSHDRKPDNAVPGVGAPRSTAPAGTGSNYAGFGSRSDDFGTNRPR
jgi:hypothetical protein